MEDIIDFALMRHGEMAEAIEKREAEIEKLREQKENLEIFVSTAKELGELSKARKGKDRDERDHAPSMPRVLPVRSAQSA